jgi:hypothetical protein
MIENSKNLGAKNLLILVISLCFLFIQPILVIFISILFFKRSKLSSLLLIILFCCFFSYINFHKDFYSDYIWYFAHYNFWVNGSLDYPFYYPFFNVYAKITEPVYHFMSFALSRLSNGDKFSFDLFFTSLIYTLSSFGVYLLCGKFNRGNNTLFIIVIISLFLLSINPVMVTQLIRQNISGAFLFLSFSLLYIGRHKSSFIFGCLSLLTHNSMVFPMIAIFGALFIFDSNKFKISYILLLFSIGYFLPFIINNYTYDVMSKSDGNISSVVYFYDFILLSMSLLVAYKEDSLRRLFFVVLCLYLFILSTFSSELLFLRYYLMYDYFRVINYIIICAFLLRKKYININVVLYVVIFLGWIFCTLRYEKSDFNFHGDFNSYLTNCYVCNFI